VALKVRYVRTAQKPEEKKIREISFLPVGEPVLTVQDLGGKPEPLKKEEPLEELEELVEESEEFHSSQDTVDFSSFESLPWEKVLHHPGKTAPAAEPTPAPPEPPPAPVAAEPPEPENLTVEAVSRKLIEAVDREDIADVLASYLGEQFAHAALFVVRGGVARGWRCFSKKTPQPEFERFEAPLNEPSVLQMATTNKAFFLGSIVRTPFNSSLIQELGGSVPRMVLVLPIIMMSRVVGLVYVDDDNQNLSARLAEMQKLVAKAAMSFDILILKNKILTT